MADTTRTQRTRPDDSGIYIALLQGNEGPVSDENNNVIKIYADSGVPTEYTERTPRVRI